MAHLATLTRMNITLKQRQQRERNVKTTARANNHVAAQRMSPARLVLLGLGVPYAMAVMLISAFDPHFATVETRLVGGLCVLAAAAYVHYLECFFRIARIAARRGLATLLGLHLYATHEDSTASWDADAPFAQRVLVWLADAAIVALGFAGPVALAHWIATVVAERIL